MRLGCCYYNKVHYDRANQSPGHDIYQLPPHRENGIGMLPVFERVMKIK